MTATGDLIDFEVIESSKENIQSLPSGRSAKSLARILSPVATASPSQTQDINDSARQAFEKEIQNIDESDDPLDVYDRYVKWTLDTYPSAQATPQSQLLPLLERATKTFMSSSHYKNDPRYVRIWLNYIRFFSDAPRETFAYLSRHSIGADLALFYEEFAAWLEGAGRWNQAEEIYKMGIEREARPVERLVRKFGEFEKRKEAQPEISQEPSSPALPTVRPALAAKLDPFASSSPEDQRDPQAAARGRSTAAGKRSKLEIFADDGKQDGAGAGASTKGWNNMGTLAERKKENAVGATPWAGETMPSAGGKAGMPAKMMIFKDPSMSRVLLPTAVSNHPVYEQRVKNPRTGRYECVAINLEALYPNPEDPSVEFCFDELMLARRGDFRQSKSSQLVGGLARSPLAPSPRKALDNASNARSMPASRTPKTLPLNDLHDENNENALGYVESPLQKARSKKQRKEEKANKTRKIVMREVRGETQTIQTNFDSPQKSRIRRKKSAEPTMTLHSKEAQDEMYEIFNAPLRCEQSGDEAESHQDSGSSSEESDDEDDYASAGESTGTGHISGGTSDFGDDTHADLTGRSIADGEATATNTGWTDFNTQRDVPGQGVAENDEREATETVTGSTLASQPAHPSSSSDDLVTPTSPEPPAAESKQTLYIPIPPEDYEPPRNPYRNPDQVARSRLPFMTPIVEKTESSFGTATKQNADDSDVTDNFVAKTPCPKGEQKPLADLQDPPSSPFQDLLAEISQGPRADSDRAEEQPKAEQVAQVERAESKTLSARTTLSFQQSATSSRPPSTSSSAATTITRVVKESGLSKGPIIKDRQCNPMDEHIRSTILQEMHPPLHTFKGYFAHPEQSSNRRAEIKKFCKANKANAGGADAPVLSFEGGERPLVVRRELGAGAYAPVYLAEHAEDEDTESTTSDLAPAQRRRLEAVKMEEPSSSWEFYILRAAKRRLGVSRAADSIIDAYELHVFADECFLIEEYRAQGTLLDLVNASVREHALAGGGASGPALEEPLAMFFAVELLRTVEALHAKGIVHGDLKPDNVLVRLDDPLPTSGRPELAPRFAPSGAGGWAAKGVALIDFGRGIDMRAFRADVAFVADWATGPTDCAEMRELRPWTFQADYHGVASVLHTLLFGRYMDSVADKGAADAVGAGGAKTWRVREPLKRYWQVDLWGDAFNLLLNSGRAAEAEEGGRLPALRGLRGVRERMESWLEEHGERGVGLRTLLRRAEGLVSARRRA